MFSADSRVARKVALQTYALRIICSLMIATCVAVPSWSRAQAQEAEQSSSATAPTENSSAVLPDEPSSAAAGSSRSFGSTLGTIGKTIGEDELHIIKAPFSVNALKWDALVVGATAVLISNDESVLYQVPVSWHQTSLNISDAATYGSAAIAGGIYLTGLMTKNEEAQETGIRTAEATVDSVIVYAVMKSVLQRQRPFTGEGEGKFFSGNWTNGSFPSGHAMFTWTIASTVAHRYHSLPLKLLMYGIATTVSTTRVTAGVHFPADVFVGSVFGYLIGDYVSHKPESGFPIRSENKVKRIPQAVLQHVTIGVQ
jgi:hypothetical protein